MKRNTVFIWLALSLALCQAAPMRAQDTDAVLVTVAEESARPGDRVLIPVEVSGLEGREILAGEVKVKFDPSLLAGQQIVKRGALIGGQSWLTADQIDSSSADYHVFQVVFAASRGFTRDGELFFMEFAVDSTAEIGATTTLEVFDASFNNGEPGARLGTGVFTVVSQVVRANFTARPRRGSVPLEVHFFDNSSGEIETYEWDFGDGEISAEQNPVHAYTAADTYTVSLTVTGPEGSATKIEEDFIEALPDTTAPEIINGPKAVDVKQDRADILWITNEAADSFVEYSMDEDFADSDSVRVAEFTHQHKVRLEGLEAGTRYFVRVQSTDPAGNASIFKRGFFTTRNRPDTKPPVIVQGPSAGEITQTSAAIVWRTNEVSSSVVEYATLGDFTDPVRVEDGELVEDHRIALEGLEADTRYFYRVQSADSEGNESKFKSGTFKTLAAPDETAPVILLGPVAIGRTHQSATIKWVTDERSDSQVDYGPGTEYGQSEREDAPRLIHLVRLTNLEPSTLYHAQVTSTDAAGNAVVSADFEFITRGEPDTRWPKIVLRPFVLGRFVDRLIVRWETDEPCAGLVEYGEDDAYGNTARSDEEGRVHTVVLTDLDEDQEYHFRVSVTDLSGNGPVFGEPLKGRTLATPKPLQILQGPIVADRGEDRVTLRWKTNRPADRYVEFGPDQEYGGRAGGADLGADHEVVVAGLEPGTLYHARVVSTDPGEETVESGDFTFTTRAAADVLEPLITFGPETNGLTETSALITWRTSEPTDALVEYGADLNYGETVFLEEFVDAHRVSLTGLDPGQTYHFQISSKDRAGNGPAVSADLSFSTLEEQDKKPPVILAGPGIGDLQAGQVTIVWRTDEPADSFVDYGESAAYGNQAGDSELTREHEVTLTGLASGTLYHYRVSSTDPAGNTSTTDPAGSAKWSRDLTLRTRQEADTRPPAIVRGPLIIAAGKSALISFDTDEPCIARLAYGTAQTLGTPAEEVVYETGATTSHRIRLGHLKTRTRYLFQLVCRDAAGNELEVGSGRRRAKVVPLNTAGDLAGALEFSTEESDDAASPVIVEGPTLLSRTADTAIIAWKTDEPATSRVDFGLGDLSQSVADAEYATDHQVYLTGLEPSSQYSYQVRSTDFAGNAPVVSQILSFTTAAEADLTPPSLVGEPRVSAADVDQAVVEWVTDEPTSVSVHYGAGEELDQVLFREEFATEHLALLTGLQAGTTYRYQLSLTDASGNGPVLSAVLTFETAAEVDAAPPQLSRIGAGEIGDMSAVITWITDEPASSFVYYGSGDSLDLAAGDAILTTAHRVTLTNLIPEATYQYQVESIDPAGNRSGASALAEFATAAEPDEVAPPAPAALIARVGLETAVLSWSPSAAPDLAGYTLYRQVRSGDFAPVATGLADTAYVDEGLFFGTSYTYYVTAVDLAGNESAPSAAEGGTPSVRNVPGQISPADAQVAGSQVTLTTTNALPASPDDVLTYTFHVSNSELFDDIVARGAGVAQGSGTTSWTFEKELVPGQEYWWRARASDGTFDGPWSFPSFFVGTEPVSGDPGDFDGNGKVDFDDFFRFANGFGKGEGEEGYDAALDLVESGGVDFEDFFRFADLFGTVYSSSRPVVAAAMDAGLEISARTRLAHGEALVELRAAGAAGWRDLGLAVGYDPAVLELIPGEEQEADFARGTAGTRPLRVWLETAPGEVTLLAHRTDAAPFSGDGSLGFLRFRPLNGLAETGLELRTAAVQTADGIVRLPESRLLRVRLVPERFALAQNFPNPFNPETAIEYDLASGAQVRLEVFDLLGQRLRTLVDEPQAAGRYRLRWDGRDEQGHQLASGVYFCRLEASGATGGFQAVRKMLLVR